MYVRKNNINFIVQDNQAYVGLDGTKYPSNYPKSDIAELTKVIEVECPNADVIVNWSVDETYTQVWNVREFTNLEKEEQIVNEAKILLEKSDMVAIRCVKAGMGFPVEWKNYVETLREIVKGNESIIPQTPDYPQGS